MLLTESGLLFSFGSGQQGQLGHNSKRNSFKPKLVFSLTQKKIAAIAAGWNHSMVLTTDSHVYVSGHGLQGALGLGDTESRRQFTLVEALCGKRVGRIFAGGGHSWAVLDYVAPIVEDYQPPSPLRSPLSSPKNTRSEASGDYLSKRSQSPYGRQQFEDSFNDFPMAADETCFPPIP